VRPYTNLQNLYDRDTEQSTIDLTDDDRAGTVVVATVDNAIEKADDLIDSYLLGRVSCLPFPVDENPAVVEDISTELTVYYLYLRRFASDIPEGIMFRYKEAMKKLKDIAKGEIIICPVDATKPSVKTKSPAPIYTPESLLRY